MADGADSDPRFIIERLDPDKHERESLDCGVDALNRYLTKQAMQDMRRHLAAVFVMTTVNDGRVVGYFTLSQCSIRAEALPAPLLKRLPRFPHFPATLIGRLAVDRRHQGKGLGQTLLIAAMRQAYSVINEVASWAIVVDAKDERAQQFYTRLGFQQLGGNGLTRRLFLPMSTVEQVLKSG